jgi:hypothetical protein
MPSGTGDGRSLLGMLSEINRKLGNLQTGLPITGGSYYTPIFRIGQPDRRFRSGRNSILIFLILSVSILVSASCGWFRSRRKIVRHSSVYEAHTTMTNC